MIEITAFDLPSVPGVGTELWDLPDEQQREILLYCEALWRARCAGFGDRVVNPERFIDGVVARLVRAARSTSAAWTTTYAQMQREMEYWERRHAAAQLKGHQPPAPSTGYAQATANRVNAVMTAFRASDEASVSLLEQVAADAWQRDRDLAADALRELPQPAYGSLLSRAVREFLGFHDQSIVKGVAKRTAELPLAVRYAVIGAFLSDRIATPYKAMLLGPWAQAMEGDPSLLEQAWTEEAQALRANFIGLPQKASEDPDDEPF